MTENPLGPDTLIEALAPEGRSSTEIASDPVIGVTVTVAELNLLVSWTEVPVIVAVPVDPGVKTPALLMEPMD